MIYTAPVRIEFFNYDERQGSSLAQGKQQRKEKCADIVDEMKALSSLAATGNYRGQQWWNISEKTVTVQGGLDVDLAFDSAFTSLTNEMRSIRDLALGSFSPFYGGYTGLNDYYEDMSSGDYGSAMVSLMGGTAGTLQSIDSLSKLSGRGSLLTASGSTLLKRAGSIGVVYTAGSLYYGAVNNYTENNTKSAMNSAYKNTMEMLQNDVSERMEPLNKAYSENNCAEFY